MGAFYGSVHVRSGDHAGLQGTLEEMAAQGGTRFLVAPPCGGWISLYPSGHGQDVSVSAALALHVSGPVLHLLVHDDDLFAYALYDAGVLIDEYWSDPHYFEAASPARWRETAGRPHALAALSGGEHLAELTRVLSREGKDGQPFRATWQMTQVAALLGIAIVETSYEYLRGGETQGIKGWKDFVHIPNLSAEKAAKRRRRAEVAATTKRLQREGLLLLAEKRAVGGHCYFPPRPVFCGNPRGGFLLAWSDLGAPVQSALQWWQPPWRAPSEVGLDISSKAHRIAVSPGGRFLAVGHAAGEWSVALFDLRNRRRLATLELPRAANHVSFTPDERTMICRSEGQLRLVSTDASHNSRSLVLGGGQSATVHPDGRLLVADVQGGVAVVDLTDLQVVRVLATAQNDLNSWMAANAAGKAVTGFRPQEVPNQVGFARGGRLIVVAVNDGVRVYSWEEVLRATVSLPAPVASADNELVQVSEGSGWHRNTYRFAVHSQRDLVLFSGLEGRVDALNIRTGEAATVFEIPGRPPVTELALAEDGATLALVTDPGAFTRSAKRPAAVWQVWDLEATMTGRTRSSA